MLCRQHYHSGQDFVDQFGLMRQSRSDHLGYASILFIFVFEFVCCDGGSSRLCLDLCLCFCFVCSRLRLESYSICARLRRNSQKLASRKLLVSLAEVLEKFIDVEDDLRP